MSTAKRRLTVRSLEASEFGERRVQFDSDQTELVSLAYQLVCNTATISVDRLCKARRNQKTISRVGDFVPYPLRTFASFHFPTLSPLFPSLSSAAKWPLNPAKGFGERC